MLIADRHPARSRVVGAHPCQRRVAIGERAFELLLFDGVQDLAEARAGRQSDRDQIARQVGQVQRARVRKVHCSTQIND